MQKAIVLTVNENYQDQVAVTLSSLFTHNPKEHAILFHTIGVRTGCLKQAFGDRLQTVLIEPDDTSWFPNGTFDAKTVEGMCLRLKALDYLMDHYPELERILYMDCDIIVEDCIEEVWRGPVQGKFVAAALDFTGLPEFYEIYRHHFDWERRTEINRNYFNSGVMLINMFKLAEHYKGKIASGFKEMYDGTWLLPDQDYLNIILTKDCPSVILPKPFNFMHEMQSARDLSASMLIKGRDQASKMAKVIHYAGTNKPWVNYDKMVHINEPFMQLRFDKYYRACKNCRNYTQGKLPSQGFLDQVQKTHEDFRFVGMMLGDLIE